MLMNRKEITTIRIHILVTVGSGDLAKESEVQ